MKPSRCPYCARHAGACWIMPCLTFQQALDTEDDVTVRAWAVAARIAVRKTDGTWLGSRRLVARAKANAEASL